MGIIDSLETAVRKLNWQVGQTEWADYYDNTNYSTAAVGQKHQIVRSYLQKVQPQPQIVWDLGANDGTFSRLASNQSIPTIAFDIDPSAVESNYLQVRSKSETNILPLLMDLTNPSAALVLQRDFGHRHRLKSVSSNRKYVETYSGGAFLTCFNMFSHVRR